ncbi:sulfite exporter TauE/SafE family protein [Oceanicoccus sagamiensis]|uniref:Cytochrome biogenesis protein n=1 Tax=Oceanicoccus sagamiensis TaxID=716816 RepID=A0A1X9NC56_9GAMM|nr:sulfite exporter TauE/SafE family protein [Oceanicoccus sagamiensis]ARN74751.1 cytochrome biogenesis protein [Oceanicoccus sagamiensis]
MNELTLTSAVLIGLLGSSHCLGMCGGLSSVLGVNAKAGNRSRIISYNAGRLLTYTVIGAVAGLIGEALLNTVPQAAVVLRAVAGLLIIAMGLYVSQWWMGLTQLEKIGARFWRYIQPLTGKLLPINNHRQALLLGTLWGLLPCGLVYSTLSWALASAQWQQSAMLMLAFGIGTLPAMLSMGFVGEKILQRLRQPGLRRIAGLVIIVMGIATLLTPVLHSGHEQHAGHQHHDM